MRHARSLLVYEILSTLRWLLSGTGRYLLLGYAGFSALELIWIVQLEDRFAFNELIQLLIQAVFFVVLVGVLIWTWVFLIRAHTLKYLDPDRLRDLLVTRVDQEDLWPALLVRPTLTLGCMASLSTLLWALLPPLLGEPHSFLEYYYLHPPDAFEAEELRTLTFIWFAQVPIEIVWNLIYCLALTTFAVRFSDFRTRGFKLVSLILLGNLLLIPEGIIAWLSDDAYLHHESVTMAHQMVSDLVIGPSITVVLGIIAYRFLVHYLRGDRHREKLRDSLEAG